MAINYQMNFIGINAQDILPFPMVSQGRRLDADEYWADDLDGGTESVFGSGNVAYAVLQASQLDPEGHSENTPVFDSGDIFINDTANVQGVNYNDAIIDALGSQISSRQGNALPSFQQFTDANASSGLASPVGNIQTGGFNSMTAGSVGASQFVSDRGGDFFTSGGSNTATTLNGQNGAAGQNGTNGTDGGNGQDGAGSQDGGNTTITIENIVNNTFNLDITNLNDIDIIYEVLDNVDDLIVYLNITTTNLTDILNTAVNNITNIENITDIFTVIANNLHKTIDNSVTEVSSLVTQVLQLTETLTANVFNTIDNTDLIELLGTKLGELESIHDVLNGVLTDVSDKIGAIGLPNEIPFEDLYTLTDSVDHLLSKVTGHISDLAEALPLADSGNTSGDGIISELLDPVIDHTTDGVNAVTAGALDDTLQTVDDIGNTVTDMGDNLVENILGNNGHDNDDVSNDTDIDIAADIGLDTLPLANVDVEAVVDIVEDLAGDIDLDLDIGAALFNTDSIDNESGDGDITITLDEDIVDTDLLGGDIELDLDGIEAIVGDIDLDLDLGQDLFGNQADPVVDTYDGGSNDNSILADIGNSIENVVDTIISDAEIDLALDIFASDDGQNGGGLDSLWTETIGDSSELFGDLGDAITNDCGLPDPTGAVAEGLGALVLDTDYNTAGLEGLFG